MDGSGFHIKHLDIKSKYIKSLLNNGGVISLKERN